MSLKLLHKIDPPGIAITSQVFQIRLIVISWQALTSTNFGICLCRGLHFTWITAYYHNTHINCDVIYQRPIYREVYIVQSDTLPIKKRI